MLAQPRREVEPAHAARHDDVGEDEVEAGAGKSFTIIQKPFTAAKIAAAVRAATERRNAER